MTHYIIKYSLDGINWHLVDDAKEFEANKDHNSKIINYFAPIRARTVKICPTKWKNYICMRFEVYFSDIANF